MFEIKTVIAPSTKLEEVKNYKEKARKEIEKDIYYVCEENYQLERDIRAGLLAKEKLESNRTKITNLMKAYLKMEEG